MADSSKRDVIILSALELMMRVDYEENTIDSLEKEEFEKVFMDVFGITEKTSETMARAEQDLKEELRNAIDDYREVLYI